MNTIKALSLYLGICIDRIAARILLLDVWHYGRETLEYPFGRQAIPMVFDFPESNPFCNSGWKCIQSIGLDN